MWCDRSPSPSARKRHSRLTPPATVRESEPMARPSNRFLRESLAPEPAFDKVVLLWRELPAHGGPALFHLMGAAAALAVGAHTRTPSRLAASSIAPRIAGCGPAYSWARKLTRPERF